ncbi:hypothetical protein, partial [Escherichia coli]|uniref:hypothetical protein n=1 Tax=Escherichia coli TaxID=562 RepID=UPI001BAE9695
FYFSVNLTEVIFHHHMTFNSPDMKFTKNTLLKNETDVFYIHQKISPLPADKVNKHACLSM